MKTGCLFIIILILSILISCKRGYKVEGDKVYFEYWNEGSGQNKQLVESADAKTFKTLSFDSDFSLEFGRDKDHLFIDGELIKNIDPNSFKYLANFIFYDKDSAYFLGFYNNLQECVIKGVKPDKITLIKYPWAKAGNILIHGRDTLTIDDINEFFPIDNNWGKTNRYIINNNQILYGADVESFRIISSYEGKDCNFNYEFGAIKQDDFKKEKYSSFNFCKINNCHIKPIAFVDICDSLVSYQEDKFKPIKLVEKLKEHDFIINDINYLDWIGDSKIIRVSMANKNCNCIVEKLYRYDYGKPSQTENAFEITERIYSAPNLQK